MKYLLACPQCGSKLTVETGQAGQQLRCSCGQEIEVPSIRHLRELEMVADATPAQAAWSARQGLMFLGMAIIVVSVATGGAIAALRPAGVGDKSFTLQIDKEAVAREVNALSPSEAYSKLELVEFAIPGYSEQLAKGAIPPLLAPCLKLLENFEGKGPTPLAPQANRQTAKEVAERATEIHERLEARRNMDDWLWLVGLAAVAGLVLICVSAVLPRGRRARRATAGSTR